MLVEITLEQPESVIFCGPEGPEIHSLPEGAVVWVAADELPAPEAFGVDAFGSVLWLIRAN